MRITAVNGIAFMVSAVIDKQWSVTLSVETMERIIIIGEILLYKATN